jgi:hypothetical protein
MSKGSRARRTSSTDALDVIPSAQRRTTPKISSNHDAAARTPLHSPTIPTATTRTEAAAIRTSL